MSKLNLIVGCGGSGLTTLKTLNRLLVLNPETLPRMSTDIYYLAVDTNAADLEAFEDEIRAQMGDYDPPFIQKVQLSEGVGILNEVVKENFVDPFTGTSRHNTGLDRLRQHWWFDADGNPFDGQLITGNLCDGAGQCPPASYGLAWYNLAEINTKIKQIVDQMVANGYGNKNQLKEMNLAIVAGLAGGTGRGCWSLIMFKIREYLLKEYKVTAPPVGIFFDSSVFDNVANENEGQRTALKVNALTGLSELSCWVRNGSSVKSKRFAYDVPSMKTPWLPSTDVLKVDITLNPNGGTPVSNAYLICGRNGGTAKLDANWQYHEMAGAGLYSMIVNPQLGARQINDNDPINSFGAATFEVDTVHIRSYFETRARRMALDSLANAGESAAAEVDEFLKDNPVVPTSREVEELRPNPQGTILQRAVAALFSSPARRANFSTMETKFTEWSLEEATSNVTTALIPATPTELSEAVRTALHSFAKIDGSGKETGALDGNGLTDAVVKKVLEVFRGKNGQEPSVARVKAFLVTLRARILRAGMNVAELSSQLVKTKVVTTGTADEAMKKTLEVFSKRTLGEILAFWKNIGPFNQAESKQLIAKDVNGEYWGIIPKAILAINLGNLKQAFDQAFTKTIDKIDLLARACDQFRDCCQEASETFALEELEAAGKQAGNSAFEKLFSTPDQIEDTLYGVDNAERFYHRVLRPIFRDPKDMEETIRRESVGKDGVEIKPFDLGEELTAFISKSVEGGLLESLAEGGSDRRRADARAKFVNDLTDEARASVRLSDSFMERHFSFERILDRNREFWNEAIRKTAGSAARFNRLKGLLKRTLGAEPRKDPKRLSAPPQLPPTDELLMTIGMSLVSTCAPWWDAQTAGAHHSILLFVPFVLSADNKKSAGKEKFSRFIREKAPHVPKVTPYGTSDTGSGATLFNYVAFSAAGLKLSDNDIARNEEFQTEPEKQTFLFDKIVSLSNDYADPDVAIWLRRAEDPSGASIFSTESQNKGLGYPLPLLVRDKKLSSFRWKPWLRDDETTAAAAENQAADLMLYALLGTGLTEALGKSLAEKLAPYGWSLPAVVFQEKGQKWLLNRKTFAWDEDEGTAVPNTECEWNKGQLLCTSACNLDSMLCGKGFTGKNGAARQSDVDKGNQLRSLLATESALFEGQIVPKLGEADMKKLVKARTAWLTARRDKADPEDKPVFDRLLKRSSAK